MGPAGSFALLWLLLGALGPSPTPAHGNPECLELNSTHCGCPRGYEGPPWDRERSWDRHCQDINECVGEGPPPCPPSQSCYNTEGSFRCECNRGYRPRNRSGTPKNGAGTPKNGSGTPKNGAGTPKNGAGTPENGSGTPKNGAGTPKNGSGTPENGSGTPKNGAGTPKNGSGTPKNGTGTIENGTGTPENGTGTPENGSGTPKNGSGTPENGSGTPKNGTGTPKNGSGTPENGSGTPKNGTGTPENGIGTIENGTGTPKNGSGTPENGTGTPKNGSGTPKNGSGTPKNGTGTIENGSGTPENGSGTPKNGTGTPENGSGTPENGTEPPLYCEDVDECAEVGEGLCGGGSVCLNTPGSFECHCPPPGRGPPGPGGCPAVPVSPEICGEDEGCDLGQTLTRISEELRGGRDPRSVLQELLAALDAALSGPWASLAAPERLRRLPALLEATEGLARAAGTRLAPSDSAGTNGTWASSPGTALSLAVSRGPLPSPVTLGLPEVTLEVPPEVALDQDSGLSLVTLLTLGPLPPLLQGGPPVLWGGWGSLLRPPRRGRPSPSQLLLSPVATALVARGGEGLGVGEGSREPPRDSPEVTLRFRHPAPDPNLGGRVVCAFWNPGKGRWDSRGCREVPPKNGDPKNFPGTVCACDHLTSFAVLLAFSEIQDHWLLDLVTQVALGVSVVALVASAATFALCRALAEPRRTLQLHLSLSLLGGNLAFLLGIDGGHRPVSCTVTAVALHLCFLSAFCWMALQGLHLHVLLVQVFAPAWLRPRLLLALGYGPAVLIVAIAAAVFPGGYGTDQYCWLSLERGFRWSFQGPVIVITAANAVILVVTLWKLVQKFNEINPDRGHLRRIRVLLVTSLGQLSLLGSGWALGVGAGLGWAGGAGPPLPPGSAPPPLPLLFCIVNAAQGLLIFLCHCLGHPKVRGWYRSLLCPRSRPYSEFTSNTSNTSTSRVRGSQSHQ